VHVNIVVGWLVGKCSKSTIGTDQALEPRMGKAWLTLRTTCIDKLWISKIIGKKMKVTIFNFSMKAVLVAITITQTITHATSFCQQMPKIIISGIC